ncbi:hypothetical protein Vretimale_4855 [Volvox reticuliferus]|nr:hypothetical protein Vretifemale_3477 [Volvox reticuliferus]GIL99712.1 hypothetical protein Vretimale_4855 [Volvox reticuliferus]
MILPAMLVRGDRDVIKQVEEEEEAKQATLLNGQQEALGPKSPANGGVVITEPPLVLSIGNAGSGGADGLGCLRQASPVPLPAQALSGPMLLAPPLSMALPSLPSPVLPQPPSAIPSESGVSRSGKVNGNRSRLSVLLLSHEAILRAFHASVMQPWFMVAWIFIGIGLYICGVVLAALGIRDSVAALEAVLPISLWQILHKAIIAVFIVFGVLHLAIIVTSIWVRPTRNQLCLCGPKALKCSMECLNRSWAAHAVLVGLLVMEMNVSMLMFALGLMLWIARFIMTEACIFAVTTVFNGISFLEDICLDLSSVGLPDQICGSVLTSLCIFWGELHVDFLCFGSMCFIIAQAMFLVLATTNYVATRTGYAITTVMQLTLKTEEERARAARAHGSTGTGSASGRLIALFRGSTNGARSRSKAGLEQASGGGGAAAATPDGVKGRITAANASNKGVNASGNGIIEKSGKQVIIADGAAAGKVKDVTDRGPDRV